MHTAETPPAARFGAAQPLTEKEQALSTRIDRLLAKRAASHVHYVRIVILSVSALTFLILCVIQGINLLIIFSLLHCNPLVLLSTLL
ncbi:hypothetical protein KSF_058610 [Reticulibacter mediterranei]|uniref:Uncharacterized protein n=1 Tax=Reticulibacter mediterranei TaxID=2778369 RepID=A0A8J3N4U1_9CHLR|nr:hypothetical protein [Reticulibacter mediterranei]GHO95813.1 hypothetical protein KSF_058610 [Reticulibacter mediterranei]